VKRDNLAFLLAGLAFGSLVGFAAYHSFATRPNTEIAMANMAGPGAPRGTQAPTQTGGPNTGGGAPMMAEINALKRALQADPNSEEALLRLANIYHDAGMFEQAAGYYERVVELAPHNPNVLTDLGVCYRSMRQFDRALEKFAEARRVDPQHWQSLFNAAVVAGFDLGQYDVADEALDAIEALDPPPADLDRTQLEQLRHALEQSKAAVDEDGAS
jgi:Tfp pilus assembly protein PilF